MWISKNSKLNKRNQTRKISCCMLPYPCVRKIPWKMKWQFTPVFFVGNPMDRGAWWATVHGLQKSRTWLSMHTHHFLDQPKVIYDIWLMLAVALDLREMNCKRAWGNFLVWWKCSISWLEWLLHEYIHLSSNHTLKWVYFIACIYTSIKSTYKICYWT